MPFKYKFNLSAKRVEIEATGKVNASDIIDIADKHLSDPLWVPGYDIIVDYSKVEELGLSYAESIKISEHLIARKSDYGNARLAFVTPQDVVFGSARMFAVAVEDLNIEIQSFRTKDEALAWLTKPK